MTFLTEEEYVKGLRYFKCNTLSEVRNKITGVRESLLDIHSEDFRQFYDYLFDINNPCSEQEKSKKTLDLEIVEVYFNALFCNQFAFVKEFLQYLKEKNVGLIWDEYDYFLDFLKEKGANYPNDYQLYDVYPLILDNFYKWYCNKHGIKIPEPKKEDDLF